ncbi:MAG: hypothetical protein R3A13_04250 [Bdellovibrionota bacterium]
MSRAWQVEALNNLSDPQKSEISKELLDTKSFTVKLQLAKQFDSLYKELAAERLSFEDAAKACETLVDCHDEDRWYVLEHVIVGFNEYLAQKKLIDVYYAREQALSENRVASTKEIIIIGASDLNATVKAFIDQISDSVNIFVHAPESMAEEFDAYGCVRTEAWINKLIPVPEEMVSVEAKPELMAEKALELISKNAVNKTFEEVTCGLIDQNIEPFLAEKLGKFGIPARVAAGRALSETAPLDFIKKFTCFAVSKRFADFASLIRHQDVELYLKNVGIKTDSILEVLDSYHTKFLQAELGSNFFGSGETSLELSEIYSKITELTDKFQESQLSYSEWTVRLREVLFKLYEKTDLDQTLSDSFTTLAKSLSQCEEVMYASQENISFTEFCTLLFSDIESASLPPAGETEAVELLGWLELQLDDAPFLLCLGMNESYVPESIVADPFLPDMLRTKLGLLDNARRFARDKYILKTLLESKPYIHFIAGRMDASGEPLKVSRLLLLFEGQELAKRVQKYYDPKETPLAAVTSDGQSVFYLKNPQEN